MKLFKQTEKKDPEIQTKPPNTALVSFFLKLFIQKLLRLFS